MSRGAQHGARNHRWKGGRSIASNGYVLVRVGVDHPLADVRGYAYEHRLVAAEKLGCKTLEGVEVHHIDGDKTNNDPANLEVLTRPEHRVEHRRGGKVQRMPGEANPSVACACGCGGVFPRYDGSGRPRTYVSGHNPRGRSNDNAQRKAANDDGC